VEGAPATAVHWGEPSGPSQPQPPKRLGKQGRLEVKQANLSRSVTPVEPNPEDACAGPEEFQAGPQMAAAARASQVTPSFCATVPGVLTPFPLPSSSYLSASDNACTDCSDNEAFFETEEEPSPYQEVLVKTTTDIQSEIARQHPVSDLGQSGAGSLLDAQVVAEQLLAPAASVLDQLDGTGAEPVSRSESASLSHVAVSYPPCDQDAPTSQMAKFLPGHSQDQTAVMNSDLVFPASTVVSESETITTAKMEITNSAPNGPSSSDDDDDDYQEAVVQVGRLGLLPPKYTTNPFLVDDQQEFVMAEGRPKSGKKSKAPPPPLLDSSVSLLDSAVKQTGEGSAEAADSPQLLYKSPGYPEEPLLLRPATAYPTISQGAPLLTMSPDTRLRQSLAVLTSSLPLEKAEEEEGGGLLIREKPLAFPNPASPAPTTTTRIITISREGITRLRTYPTEKTLEGE
jgi:hypothetical protein